jgi:uncharacterized membrane protein
MDNTQQAISEHKKKILPFIFSISFILMFLGVIYCTVNAVKINIHDLSDDVYRQVINEFIAGVALFIMGLFFCIMPVFQKWYKTIK